MVVPDNEMPRNAEGKVIDIIINPSSVIARKNTPQIAEPNLSRISEEIWRRVDPMIKNKANWPKIQDILNKYHFYYLAKKSFEDFVTYHNSLRESSNKYQIITGSFSVYSPERVGQILNELGISDTEVLYDGKRNRRIRQEILTGQVYIMKLHHFSDFLNKVTADDPKDRNPLVLGLGDTRAEGQVIGEMESVA